jgi:(1->4)-alpha-D-glucan 1-alpha-D-glucosylmutase
VNLSWTNPNTEYVHALEQFISAVLEPGKGRRPNAFLPQLESFLPTVMFFGALNSLAQVVLKVMAPGVPDIYQGNELFDFSLVDPDNRRPVNYHFRQRALQELLQRKRSGDLRMLCRELLVNFQDGRVKLWTTLQALCFRRERPELLATGAYHSLAASGSAREHAVAFAREHHSGYAVVVVPRFGYTLMQRNSPAGVPAYGSEAWLESWTQAWNDTELHLPAGAPPRLKNLFTGESLNAEGRSFACAELFRHFPVALLSSD